ncbi:hypothetical protein FDP41_006347 [Naegleria fowleri]|uniref:Uncharacterized protein n=1 Tax=Naegleria fowleri TaxID=5763 RepID=A0A6A5B9Q7_NAEFO|nr:uncharacterized protein FDP41_006347 [Naegleria fowleri]KAF0974873.1 hypothetical protein FDP41_006347 [Naegleria fowleri]
MMSRDHNENDTSLIRRSITDGSTCETTPSDDIILASIDSTNIFSSLSPKILFETNHGNSSSDSCDFSSPQQTEEKQGGNYDIDVSGQTSSFRGSQQHCPESQQQEHIKIMTRDSQEASERGPTREEKQTQYSLFGMLLSFLSFLVWSLNVILQQLQSGWIFSPLDFDYFQPNIMLARERTEEDEHLIIKNQSSSEQSSEESSSHHHSTTNNERKSSLVLFIDDEPPLVTTTSQETTDVHPPTLTKKLSISLLEIENSLPKAILNEPQKISRLSFRKSNTKSPTLSKIPSYTGRTISPDLDPEQLYKHQRDEMIYLKHHLNCFKFPQTNDKEGESR